MLDLWVERWADDIYKVVGDAKGVEWLHVAFCFRMDLKVAVDCVEKTVAAFVAG